MIGFESNVSGSSKCFFVYLVACETSLSIRAQFFVSFFLVLCLLLSIFCQLSILVYTIIDHKSGSIHCFFVVVKCIELVKTAHLEREKEAIEVFEKMQNYF